MVWQSPFVWSKSSNMVRWLPIVRCDSVTAKFMAVVVRCEPPPFGTYTATTLLCQVDWRASGTASFTTSDTSP